MPVHSGLLGEFGGNEGRKSRVFNDAAIVGRRGVCGCLLVSAPDDERDYTLVHYLALCPEHVDVIGSDAVSLAYQRLELRYRNWSALTVLLGEFDKLSVDQMIEREQCANAHCV